LSSNELVNPKSVNEAFKQITTPVIIRLPFELLTDSNFDGSLLKEGYFITQIDIEPLTNEKELFNALFKTCEFPEYFGDNWNAVIDCLSDFHWKPAKGYILKLVRPALLPQDIFEEFLYGIEIIGKRWKSRNIPFHLLTISQ
jgi:hypothetical protein